MRSTRFIPSSHSVRWLRLALLLVWPSLLRATPPDFSREVRPILSSHCFKCHGQDAGSRKGNLRLDSREAALREGKSGATAVVPGNAAASELVKRLLTTDEDEVMPPPSAKHPLTAAQKDILQRWVAAGAPYVEHWAFAAPQPTTPPTVQQTAWPQGSIDQFVLARLEKEGLSPSPEADRATLLRRVSLDLIGLPPTVEEAEAFINDASPAAYEALVDRLLASPRYGERWARRWLDLARYADTNGYEKDRPRSMWPWRDWVIRALNADMPYDQFTIAQLAGDMLPQATEDHLVATGFHRNTMLNEEGGIDPLEFRYHAMTDRVATTGSTWLGLTVGCAQCHTHKYDPIQHTEYFGMMAFLNNTEEPSHFLTQAETPEQQQKRLAEANELEAHLGEHWPVPTQDTPWQVLLVKSAATAHGSTAAVQPDGSVLLSGKNPEKESLTLTIETPETNIDHLRLEALTHESLPSKGPGRTPHGNFVLTEVHIHAQPLTGDSPPVPIAIAVAESATQQTGFPVAHAIDGDEGTGWAVHAEGQPLNTDKAAVFRFAKAWQSPSGTRLTVRLSQHHAKHTLGRVRLSLPQKAQPSGQKRSPAELREAAREQAFAAWLQASRSKASVWHTPQPTSMKTNMPHLVWQREGTIRAVGDFTKEDHYEIRYAEVPAGTTALRLEALPHEDLPAAGPGMAYYEGTRGSFFITNFSVHQGEAKWPIAKAQALDADAALMLDENLQSGWGSDKPGQRSSAVFSFAKPWPGGPLVLKFQSGRHYAASLAHFRLSFTSRPDAATPLAVDAATEQLLATLPDGQVPKSADSGLRLAFYRQAPELSGPVQRIAKLRQSPRGQETLVMRERPSEFPRKTFLHHRGEYLQPEAEVHAVVPAFLPQLPADAPKNRLSFAQWIVSPENPLTARVAVNRAWAGFFGQGLVRTLGDFGFQGEMPSHPELLDWLALDFIRQGWSMKKLHRSIVLSATYRQSSHISPALQEKDPQNRLLARGPRFRVEAEMVRDITLRASGLLSDKMYGPPVKPPQPASVTEAAYGGGGWAVSTGEDRYRRALYTFMKRSAPFAATNTFDAPTGEACIPRRDLSNTPLQSLTLLNDEAFVETAQALGSKALAVPGDDAARLDHLFRRCLTRSPRESERRLLLDLLTETRKRIASQELQATDISPHGEGPAPERAAWTVIARTLLNLDETITKS